MMTFITDLALRLHCALRFLKSSCACRIASILKTKNHKLTSKFFLAIFLLYIGKKYSRYLLIFNRGKAGSSL